MLCSAPSPCETLTLTCTSRREQTNSENNVVFLQRAKNSESDLNPKSFKKPLTFEIKKCFQSGWMRLLISFDCAAFSLGPTVLPNAVPAQHRSPRHYHVSRGEERCLSACAEHLSPRYSASFLLIKKLSCNIQH